MRLSRYIFFVLFIFSQWLEANSLDSLKTLLSVTKDTSERVMLQYKIAKQYFDQNKTDEAVEQLIQSYSFALKKRDTLWMAKTQELFAEIYSHNEDYELAKNFYEVALSLFLATDSLSLAAHVYGEIGTINYYLGAYDKTLEYYILSQKTYEKAKDTVGMTKSLHNIGVVHLSQKNYKEAEEYFSNALNYNSQKHNLPGMANNINNLGILAKRQGNYEKAIEYFNIAFEINQQSKDTSGMAMNLNNIGNIRMKQSHFDEALKYYQQSLQLKEKINNQRAIAQSYGNIANLFLEQYDATHKRLYLNEADQYAKHSLNIAQNLNLLEEEKFAYGYLLDIAFQKGNLAQAFDYQHKYIDLLEELYDKDRMALTQSMEAKYRFTKKVQEIETQKQALEKAEIEIEKQHIIASKEKNLRNFFLIVFILVSGVALYVYQNFRQKKKAHQVLQKLQDELMLKNAELNEQNEEILTQRDEIENQKNLLEDQKDNLVELHTHLTKSIDYAERIQSSLLPQADVIKEHLSDYFLFYRPRDVVSGDFYWWNHIEGHTVVAAADSTGHGVPGAFMSTLGISKLREIVVREYITHPGVILRKLRKEIIQSLKQKGESGEQKDGMDMAVVSIHQSTKTVQFSGANNPIYWVTPRVLPETEKLVLFEETTDNSLYLYELRPDKMPIAIYERMDRFNTIELKAEPGDQIYMFSDGYADQFGGEHPKGKKFKYKSFKRLILENAHLPMREQKQAIQNTFDHWKGHHEQVDDVLVLGIRI
ncbi:MAG: tetratricopeptide repeat protein [Bacteroidales bacterium]|nr:tetratricopeptide repeat protein [Bacteroidales bacterium]